jgi:Flp pilus assembly protein TadG
MPRHAIKPHHKKEKGQTLLLVAVSLFSLIAIAALAIDLTTLYVARGEMQRAADAAALAGAKAFVDSGVTTSNTTDPNYANLEGLAQNMGTQIINALLAQNTVGGTAPQLANGTPTFDFTTHPGNPQVTVTLQRTDVPTFFAHIFGQKLVTVQATAVAEAYNSSLPPGGGGGMPPVAPSCVKPWLIPNADPGAAAPTAFIDETTGALNRAGIYPNGIIGEEITLKNPCLLGVCLAGLVTPTAAVSPNVLNYLPAQLTNTAGNCPSCAGGTAYENGSACCDTVNSYACGGTAPPLVFDLVNGLLANTVSSVECLIGAASQGTGAGQDEIGLGATAQGPANTFGNFLDTNGNDPIEIRAGSGPHSGQLVTTSPSIVTLPIYATSGLAGVLAVAAQVHVIGYMQAFVEQSPTTGGEIEIYVLNISGCGPNVNTGATPISGGGVSPVPVRLIHN